MANKEVDFVKWFSELSNKDVPIAGGKGASLAEMFNAKVPVPAGFVVTAQAYSYFLKKTNLEEKIKFILKKLDINNTEQLNKASKEIRELIESQVMPKEMQEEIVESYEILNAKDNNEKNKKNALEILESSSEDPFVAVRSSATTEDLADASFAGQQDTFLNVHGKEELLDKVKKCISSLFTARAIYYREKKGFKHEQARLAVVIQKMIDSKKSGVVFSNNPISKEDNIVIEAVFGLGEGIVSGKIKPDNYVIDEDLENFKILEIKIAKKKIAIIKNSQGENETIKLDEETSSQQVLTTYEIKRLAQYAQQLEEHYKKPQDIEFAIDDTGIYIVQSRPITTIYKEADKEIEGNVLLQGLAASPGIASGVVKVVHSLEELEKVKEGDVLVTEMTNPDMVVSMQKAAAIITDEGGITSHAAIISREMGIPAVVGTGEATQKLKDGDEVTVDGNSGRILEGKGETKLVKIEPIVQTKTEIKVIVDLPGFAERAAKSGAKAVGLLRLEGIIATSGKHPIKFVKEKKVKDYIKLLAEGIKKIAEHFEKVWIRTSDIRSDEFRNLEGSVKEIEGNPMLGDHGVRFSLKHPEIMKAELQAVKEVASYFPEKEFGIMMPQVISVEEVQKTKALSEEVALPKNIKMGIMVETPAAVQIIDDLCEEGIAFISFGTNDLTQFTLAIDRNNEDVQDIYNEAHPAVLNSLSHVIRECKKYNVQTSICGQAGSKPEMVKFLIKEGIDSISVNADAARKVSLLVTEIEGNPAKDNPYIKEQLKPAVEVIQQHEVQQESEQTSEEAPLIMPTASDKDIEETILEALSEEENYHSGQASGKENKEIPPLNDSIPIDSESFEETLDKEAELELEKEIGEKIQEELVEEWSGEQKRKK